MSASGLAGPAGVGSYAVVLTSLRTEGDDGYAQTADEMVRLAALQPGFLGVESARGPDGLGITVAYWRDEAAIRAWREHCVSGGLGAPRPAEQSPSGPHPGSGDR